MTIVGFVIAAMLGGVARWQSGRLNRPGFPIGTLAVNTVAAFVAGLAAGASTTVSLVVVTAYLGSMSTFSTVTGELVDLRETIGLPRSIAYGTTTLAAGVAVAWFGLSIAP